MLTIEPHELLDLGAFVTEWPRPLGECLAPAEIERLREASASAPLTADDRVRAAVRDLLRAGGFKPTGRSKPASEYLRKASAEGPLRPINVAVDACNVVSLHSGLPISVVDLDRAAPPFRVALAPAGADYVFNPSGQTIDVAGLLCLHDAAGPCANAVKDAQRTKTDAATRRTLSIVWSTRDLPARCRQTLDWYVELTRAAGGAVEVVAQPT